MEVKCVLFQPWKILDTIQFKPNGTKDAQEAKDAQQIHKRKLFEYKKWQKDGCGCKFCSRRGYEKNRYLKCSFSNIYLNFASEFQKTRTKNSTS